MKIMIRLWLIHPLGFSGWGQIGGQGPACEREINKELLGARLIGSVGEVEWAYIMSRIAALAWRQLDVRCGCRAWWAEAGQTLKEDAGHMKRLGLDGLDLFVRAGTHLLVSKRNGRVSAHKKWAKWNVFIHDS
jgi:hypothetical protein